MGRNWLNTYLKPVSVRKTRRDSLNDWLQQNQDWFQVELDKLYRVVTFRMPLAASNEPKLAKYLPEAGFSCYLPSGFAQGLAPTKPRLAPNRTRRALSHGHLLNPIKCFQSAEIG